MRINKNDNTIDYDISSKQKRNADCSAPFF